MAPRVIAIDGPAGSGKSTVSRAVADRLGLEYLDTGAMYRGVAFAVLERGIDPEDTDAVAEAARLVALEVTGSVCVVDGVDAGQTDLPLYMRMISSIGPSIGFDHGSAVSDRYQAPYAFTGTLHEVVIQISPDRFGDVRDVTARAEMNRQ